MGDRRAFLGAIVADPESDLPRLVFADWLEEHGEGRRAEFIRVQCELALLEPGAEKRRALQRRADALFDPAWPSPPGVAAWGWHRGFPWNWRARDSHYLEAAGWELERRLAFDVTLELTPSAPAGLAARLALDPRLGLVGTLTDFRSGSIPARPLAELLASPHWRALHTAEFWRTPPGPLVVGALCGSPAPFRLAHLSFRMAPPAGRARVRAAVRLIATCPKLAGLRSLELDNRGFGAEAAGELLASPTLPRTLRLRLGAGDWRSPELASALAARFDLRPDRVPGLMPPG